MLAQPAETRDLRSAIGRIYLQAGNIAQAEGHFAVVAADELASASAKDMNAAFLACARGEWIRAQELWRRIVAEDQENFAVRVCHERRVFADRCRTRQAVNNLAVALLSLGELKEVRAPMSAIFAVC